MNIETRGQMPRVSIYLTSLCIPLKHESSSLVAIESVSL